MATGAQMRGYSFQLHGVKELLAMFDQLPTVAMQKTVLRNALVKAGDPIVEAAKASCPVGPTGNLRESIHVSRSLKPSQRKGWRDRSVVTVYVGSNAPHAHLVEFGTVDRSLKKPRNVLFNGRWVTITHTGFVSPNPFLRNAWDAMKGEALKIFAKEMEQQIYKAARRLSKRAARGTLTKSQIKGLMR